MPSSVGGLRAFVNPPHTFAGQLKSQVQDAGEQKTSSPPAPLQAGEGPGVRLLLCLCALVKRLLWSADFGTAILTRRLHYGTKCRG